MSVDAPTSKEVGFLIPRDTLRFHDKRLRFSSTPIAQLYTSAINCC